MPGHPVAHPEEDPFGFPQFPGQPLCGLLGHPGEGLGPFWGPLPGLLLESFQPRGGLLEVFPVHQVFAEKQVGQGVGQGGVGARAELDVLVGESAGGVLVGVDVDHLGPPPSRLLKKGGEVAVGGEAVDAPKEDVTGLGHLLRVGAKPGTVGHLPGGASRGGADGFL